MLDFSRKLTPASALKYAGWKILRGTKPLNLSLRSGGRFILRRDQTSNKDYGVAYEVFVHEHYAAHADLPRKDVKFIVDLGANVGFATVYFLNSFPDAEIVAYEPHPEHFRQALLNIERNKAVDRVTLHNQAAGVRQCSLHLSNKGTSSTLGRAGEVSSGFEVEVVDLFAALEKRRIDLFKMDIEGGEYEILADPRFRELDIGAMVLEWHSRGGGHADKEWCEAQLRDMGFRVSSIFTESSHGMLWALR